ncbi:MAG: chemotaxis protein CheA [Desulfovibrionaceae bacterium]
MKESILECIEQLEAAILHLEQNKKSGEALHDVLDRLGLNHLKLPSAQVVTLFDMLADGITPVSEKMVNAFLSICEAHKRLLYSMAGFVEERAKAIRERPVVEVEVEAAPMADGAAPAAPAAQSDAEAPGGATAQAAAAPEAASDKGQGDKNQAAKAKDSGFFSIRVNTEKLDRLIEMMGKLMITYAVVAHGSSQGGASGSEMKELDAVIDQVRVEVESIRLVAMKQIFVPMHRLIKSLTQKMGKKINLEMLGEDLELDKKIMECLNEPMVHILRNAADHGVEDPEERKAAGKPEIGSIVVNAFRKGDFAYVTVTDDGRGLNPQKIRAKAEERGLLEPGKPCSDQDLFQFIMHSGFSTAEKITDVSGRGVGMDAVLNAVKGQLNGDVRIESELGKGTTFTISIPLSRSMNEGIVDALITRVAGQTFIIPSRDVIEVFSPDRDQVVTMPDGNRAVSVRGEMCNLIELGSFFGLASDGGDAAYLQAVVIKFGDRRAAILIDEVLSQQQVVITGFTVPIQELYDVPILGYGMMGESDALVVDIDNLVDRCGSLAA